MHDFHYKNNRLYCEKVDVSELAARFGTPLYVYSHHTIMDHYLKLKKAFSVLKPLICFSVKSNSNLTILKSLVDQGAGLDIVSGGELYRARKIGTPPERIVYASVGKTENEIEEAMRAGIFAFNVESLNELGLISEVAARLKKDARACLRLNPNVDPHTHRYITTGTIENKFGIDFEMARIIFLNRSHFKRVKLVGLHVHLGSQITQAQPFLAALKKVCVFLDMLKKMGIALECLNIGGGLGIIYKDESPQTAEMFAKQVIPILKKTGLKIVLEPGRFIVGNAGILVAKVIYLKETKTKRFVIVDTGMNDLMRPSLYEAYHEVVPVVNLENQKSGAETLKKSDVVGPICESSDFLAKNRDLPIFEPGDFLAVLGAGAYGFSMSSNYNSRCRAAEVMVKGDRYFLIRARETLADLTRLEKVLSL